jgi:hypothetical protein
MEPDVTIARLERRAAARRSRVEEHGIDSVTIRPGHHTRLLDVSACGALVETQHRLLPGSSVELHVQSASRRATSRGRVVRSTVAQLQASGVSYRGAIAFDQHLPWIVDDAGRRGASGPERRPAHPFRADATPECV